MKANVPPKMTCAERKAMQREIDKQLAQNVKKLEIDLKTLVLYRLHAKEGWGKVRLLRFYEDFNEDIKALERFYGTEKPEDSNFLFRKLLLDETGIDVEKLDKEMFNFRIEKH